MKIISEPLVRDYIVKLRAKAARIDRTASTMEDLAYADKLKAAAIQLEGWLREGLPGEIPVDVDALLQIEEGVEPATTKKTTAQAIKKPQAETKVKATPKVEPAPTKTAKEKAKGKAEVVEAPTQPEVEISASEIEVTAPPAKIQEIADREKTETDALRSGTMLNGRKGSYQLDKWLKSSLYRRIWLAEGTTGTLRGKQVIIKILKSGMGDQEKRQFGAEVEALEKLQHYEKDHELLQDGNSLVSTILDQADKRSEALGMNFQVQSLPEGQPLDEWLLSNPRISEATGLRIASQFCRVMEALHEGAWRGLLNDQNGDIYWDVENNRITVADLSPLGICTDALRERNILEASRLLYRLLLGLTAPESAAQRIISQPREAWDGISLASQEILTRAFHVHPDKRYKSARTMRHDLEDVLAMWDMPIEKLAKITRETQPGGVPNHALNAEEITQVQNTIRYLSVLEKKGPLPQSIRRALVTLKPQLVDWLTGKGHVENGRHHFYNQDYEAALTNFRQAVEEAWDAQVALYAARWIEIAQAAQSMAQNGEQMDVAQVRVGLDLLKDEEYEEATNLYQTLAAIPGGEPLLNLAHEASLWLLLRRAQEYVQKRHFHRAAERVREAQQHLQDISYSKTLIEIHGNLREQATNLDKQADSFEKVTAKIDQITSCFENSYGEGYQALREALDEYLTHPRLLSLAEQISQEYCESMDYEAAHGIAALGLEYFPTNKNLKYLWLVARQLSAAAIAWKQDDFAGLKSRIEQLGSLDAECTHLSPFLQAIFGEAEDKKEFFKARTVLELFPSNDRARSTISLRLGEVREAVWQDLSKTFLTDHATGLEKLKTYLREHPGDSDAISLAVRQAKGFLNAGSYIQARDVAQAAGLNSLVELAGALQEAKECYDNRDPHGLKTAVEKANSWQAALTTENR